MERFVLGCMIRFIIGFGMILGVVLSIVINEKSHAAWNEIERGIAECEAKLPRDRTCEYVIIYDEVVE